MRKNVNGQIILDTYGYNTGLAIDPIEKKPLYQFYPTTGVLSFGTSTGIFNLYHNRRYQTGNKKAIKKNKFTL